MGVVVVGLIKVQSVVVFFAEFQLRLCSLLSFLIFKCFNISMVFITLSMMSRTCCVGVRDRSEDFIEDQTC